MSRYHLSKDPECDLIEIARYIAAKASLETAERAITETIETIIRIAAHPDFGRHEERYDSGILSFPSQKYKIDYRRRKTGILVRHIFHGAREEDVEGCPKPCTISRVN